MQEPESLLRIYDITGCRKRGIKPLISISRSAFWAGVADGRYPKGLLLSARTRVWPASSIQKLIKDLADRGSAESSQ
jgi:prophage regulatory protein